ncbi:MAG TPA: integrin alpha, partial [Planctomycetota bacterium]|nr:integrin alpha [Planctomycetota bacterium]
MRSNHIRGASILVASSTLLSAVVLAGTAGTGDDAMQYRGSHVADAGDLDGDGVSDVVVAIPGTPQSGLLKEGPMYQGWAEVLSGKDFKRLRVITGEKDDIEFGLALAAGRDIDGDGVPDLVLGSPGAA